MPIACHANPAGLKAPCGAATERPATTEGASPLAPEAPPAIEQPGIASISSEWVPYIDRLAGRMKEAGSVGAEPRRALRGGRLLVVDDDPAVCQLLARILHEARYTCDTAHSGADALACLNAKTYDVVLVDLVMPEFSGLELIREIRRRRDTVRIIVITGRAQLETAIEALRLRADDYLLKPVPIPTLLEAVERSLARAESFREIRLSHQHLSRQLSGLTLQMQRRFVGGVVALATALEARDAYTKGHSSRVAALCVELGRALEIHGETLDELVVGALLHDIGKIAVPDGVLLKKDTLTREEFAIIQKHPSVGYEILVPFFGRGAIADCARYHHERYDGSGYPEGLRGGQMPLVARIISLCDAFDAMSSARPYRDAHAEARCLAEIEAGRGTQFDPTIAGLFLSIRPDRILANSSATNPLNPSDGLQSARRTP
ncbi:MAG: response regulator [Candidatus Sumerlaeia bacterium]|nr:response regulator [Candidatus Sumerlaeia bacterium]